MTRYDKDLCGPVHHFSSTPIRLVWVKALSFSEQVLVEGLRLSHGTFVKELSSSLSSATLPRLVCGEAPAGAVPFFSLGTLQIYR